MTWEITPYSLLYLLAAIVNLVTTVINWRRRASTEGIRIISVIILLVTVWLFFGFLEMAVVEARYKLNFLLVEDILNGALNILCLYLALDYYKVARWFNFRWRLVLWAILLVFLIFKLTNPWHHLVWNGETNNLPGANFVYFQHGLVYQIFTNFFIAIVGIAIVIIVRQAFLRKGWERFFGLSVTMALMLPFCTYLLYFFQSDPFVVILAYPFGYSLSSLTLSWLVFENMQRVINDQTNSLTTSIAELQEENLKRMILEAKLLETQGMLSNRLAEQSNAMAGVYDLYLLNSEMLPRSELMQRVADKIQSILGCSALGYYRVENKILALDSYIRDPNSTCVPFNKLSASLVKINKDVRVVNNTSGGKTIQAVLKQQGYSYALLKWVIVRERTLGLLVAFWEVERNVSVDEISLFNGVTEGFGLIMENSRMSLEESNEAKRVERRRLARDLHDSVTQSLHSMTLSAETAVIQSLREPDKLPRTLNHLEMSAKQALKEMRLLLYELRIGSPSETSLVDLIRTRLEAVEKRAGIVVDLKVDDDFFLPKNREEHMYPLMMEALNNSLKHAHSRQLSVHFGKVGKDFLVQIQDDGIGFDRETVPEGGMGMHNMEERCNQIDADLQIVSHPGEGTLIRVTIPADAEIRRENGE